MEECYLRKVTLLHGFFSRFLNNTNGTKLRKGSHLGIDVEAKEPLLWPASSTNHDFMKLRSKIDIT